MNFDEQLSQFIEEINQGNYLNFRNAIALNKITELTLLGCLDKLPDTFYSHLGIALQGTNVTKVDLRANNIGPAGAANFAHNLQGTNVTHVCLGENNIGSEGAANLAHNLKGTNVSTVFLGDNHIDPEGAANFARNLQGTNVTTVDLYGNHIGSEGAANFARNLQGTKVTSVDLSHNNIGPVGAAVFAHNLQGTNVKRVNLSYNKIDSKGAANFVRNLISTRVTAICLSYNFINDLTDIVPLIPFTILTEFIGLNSAPLDQALNKNRQRIEQRKAALDVAYSAHCHFDAPSTEKAYPQGKVQTQEGTQYAMGILANLQNNSLMEKILGYLPSMEGDRPSQCVELVAHRKKPDLASVKKRNLQDDASKAKRQAIDANTLDDAPKLEVRRARKQNTFNS